ncbi:hypothetical protein HYH03_005954 [Edaphochlamys debaryana]|uniref:Uncharacterized protein n=1 Tax=Edaphochlamys debaryana TaxID=47281 RepID=A0A836C1M6_9CHLO|nr:hypothetical protein HYH03_005954 [Edaphochlamys debaryana]|eukprot:KAG2496032.1 hypothetical protein HYH03_005954 [Edaphochlamys debaryana]
MPLPRHTRVHTHLALHVGHVRLHTALPLGQHRAHASFRSESPTMAKVIGFQWERYEAWRHHPLLQFNKRNAFPGLGIGIASFVAYVVYDKLNPSDDHHH